MKLQGIFLNTVPTDQNIASKSADGNKADFNYTFVETIARIAVYDDLRSAPRVIEIQPNTTAEFIENLASKIYEQAKLSGGTIPYTVIREVSENFIHAQFSEIIVSILDQGKTIRFSDQGPGIANKDKAQLPGFTSAIEPMKHYIRGVGSGLPIVKDYLDFSNGTITIEDNLRVRRRRNGKPCTPAEGTAASAENRIAHTSPQCSGERISALLPS